MIGLLLQPDLGLHFLPRLICSKGLDHYGYYNVVLQAVGQSASYAPSEQISDYYDAVMGDDAYTASVDIDDLVRIADSGSDVSGGLISQIDWDEVENLIADVS